MNTANAGRLQEYDDRLSHLLHFLVMTATVYLSGF